MSELSLKQQIQNDMKEAMRAKETLRLGTIRMLLAAIKQYEIDGKMALDDSATLAIINKMIKQRRDSIQQFTDAGRDELAEKEQQEIDVLQHYLPEPLSQADIDQAIQEALQQTAASSMKEMGKVMAILKPQLEGRADLAKVSAIIKEKLQ